ncbi:MAG: S8 family serine peptidase, partial [Lentimicrobium sp.]|nr:S8 family serine peptidase [Lentimicrobium sp.]
MKKYLPLIVLLILISLSQLFAQGYENGQLYVYVLNPNSIPVFEQEGGKIIVKCGNQTIQTLMAEYEVYSFERAFPIVDNFPQTEKYDLERVYLLKCNGDEESLMQSLNNDFLDSYDYTELVPQYYLTNTPNDYHLLDSTLGPNYALNIINAKNGWDNTTGNSTSVIGITDNGFDVTNPELTGKIDFCINNNTNIHGTFVAGIAAANTNNNLGMSSIGYNCHLALDGRWGSEGYNAILNFSLQGIRVVNASWGSCTYSRAQEDAVNLAFDNGTLIICGAGNGSNPDGSCNSGGCQPNCNGYLYPASFDRVLSVTSVGSNLSHINSDGAVHTYNDKVDVCAAGYSVISIGRDDNGNFACFKSSGTSFAAPYVSGLAGLIYSINPDFTAEQVYHIIKSTTQNIDAQNPQFVGLIGTGLIDAEAAVLKAQEITNDPGNNFNVYNGQNLLWGENDIKVVNSYIHIYPGGTLTIKGDIYLKNDAVITVERGAKLYIDGAYITSHSTQNWEGIEVWGNSALDQQPSSNQGFLKISNNTTIANSNRAIKVGKGTGDILLSTYGGGIIELENSTLINNKKGVIFSSYRRISSPFELPNKSFIRNCNFIWDKANITSLVFITLNNVSLGDISGNRFSNNTGNNEIISENNGIGILSNFSNFTVKSLNVSGSVYDSYFYNLYYGIKSEASNPVQTFKVENAYFNKVFNGIYANGSNNLRILNNTFELLNYPDVPANYPISYGLYMNGCSGYKIENNIFRNFQNSNQIRKITGIIV